MKLLSFVLCLSLYQISTALGLSLNELTKFDWISFQSANRASHQRLKTNALLILLPPVAFSVLTINMSLMKTDVQLVRAHLHQRQKTKECPLLKCRANCGELGYKSDENGCRTCECATKTIKTECSRVMCRMFCVNGFRRDENGCEICSCNSSPQPCPQLQCKNICVNGYRKDYSGTKT